MLISSVIFLMLTHLLTPFASDPFSNWLCFLAKT